MLRVVVALLLMMLLPSVGHAEKRVALVIGNSAYQHTPKLINPKNDATDMVAELKKYGFQVLEGFDLDKAGLERKVRDFAVALQGAQVGVFFYAGHGLQVAGHNYLVPVDAQLSTASTLDFEMVRLDLVHRTMEREAQTNIIFLDACRDNPLARNLARAMGTRSTEVGRGLAAVESGVGTLISFSTQPGNVALDGAGRNSPFAGALVKQLSTSNDDLSAILIGVRNDVMKETHRKQVPWEHSALTGRFYFNAAAQSTQPPQAAPARLTEAAEAWGAVKDATNIAALEAFILRYKDTFYADLARVRIEELKKQQVAIAAPPAVPPKANTPKPAVIPAPSIYAGGLRALEADDATPPAILLTADLEKQNLGVKVLIVQPPGQSYELWLIGEGRGAQSLGLLERGEAAKSLRPFDRDVVKNASFAVTIEPLGGSPTGLPTGLVRFTGKLKPQIAAAVSQKPACEGVEMLVGSERKCLRPKDSFKDCPDCPEMVMVPAGSFMMGSSNGESNEKPVHKVTIGRPFAVGRFEATFAEWDACVAAGSCKHTPKDWDYGRDRRPVIEVSWDDITTEYLPWLSGKTGKTYRLLTEAEWEYAARGLTSASAVHTTYSWGNDIGSNHANCGNCGSPWSFKQTAPVGSFEANAFGLHDMHGNAAELVQDCYKESYEGAASDGKTAPEVAGCTRVVRGGDYYHHKMYVSAAGRWLSVTDDRNGFKGFRVARALE
jgi:formylglycine-generating enzyme required for sulfatase activity